MKERIKNFLKLSILPYIIAAFYFVWSRFWRFRVIEHPEFTKARLQGRVCFAHWHGDEMVVLRLGPIYKCAAMTSTSADGELMTRILKIFGFGVSRGSSTRGGARALIGMVRLIRDGYNGTVAVDGPKGPRLKVKPGILYLSQHSSVPIIPTGVATNHAFIFKKSWNKTFLPLPFAKVVVSFGKPVLFTSPITDENLLDMQLSLENHLNEEAEVARKKLNKET